MNASEWVDQHWPFDGPHDAETVVSAATAVTMLVRYLCNATGPGNSVVTLEWAHTTNRITGHLSRATYGFDQLLTQLADGLERHATDPELEVYDDRRDRPGADTAREAMHWCRDAVGDAKRL